MEDSPTVPAGELPARSRGVVSDLRWFFLTKPAIPTLIESTSDAARQDYSQRIKQRLGIHVEQYSILMAMTGELIEKLHLSDRLPAHGHTLVSNLPGPRETLYLQGAKVEQMYPLSLLLPGLHTNITLFSVGETLNFGIVATRDLENLDLLAQYIKEEFENLEKAVYKAA